MTTNRKKIACYISSHGFGHAVRSSVIIDLLAKKYPRTLFFIISGSDKFIFQHLLKNKNVFLRKKIIDFGLVQKNPREFSLDKTADKLENMITDFGSLIDRERNFIKRENITAIYSDIAFLPFEVASQEGLPSIGMGNFTWDWIYNYYKSHNPIFKEAANLAAHCYQKGDIYLQLPGSPSHKIFPKTKNIPLVCRQVKESKLELKRSLQLPLDKKIVTIAFSQLNLSKEALNRIGAIKEAHFIIPSPVKLALPNSTQVDTSKVGFPQIIKASDTIMTKPGYGIVSDAISSSVPLINTERGDFPELPYLKKLIKKTVGEKFISQEKFENGAWEKAIKRIKTRKINYPINGAEKAIKEIATHFDL